MGVFYDRNWSILSVRKITRKQHGNYLKINEISKIAVHEFNNFLVSWTILCTLQVSTFYCYCYRLKIRTRNWRLMNTLFKSFTELERVRQFTINYITNGTRWRLSLDTICRAPTEAWQFAIKIKVGSVSFRGLVLGFLSALVHSHVLLPTTLETAITVETLNSTRHINVLGTWTKCYVVITSTKHRCVYVLYAFTASMSSFISHVRLFGWDLQPKRSLKRIPPDNNEYIPK